MGLQSPGTGLGSGADAVVGFSAVGAGASEASLLVQEAAFGAVEPVRWHPRQPPLRLLPEKAPSASGVGELDVGTRAALDPARRGALRACRHPHDVDRAAAEAARGGGALTEGPQPSRLLLEIGCQRLRLAVGWSPPFQKCGEGAPEPPQPGTLVLGSRLALGLGERPPRDVPSQLLDATPGREHLDRCDGGTL